MLLKLKAFLYRKGLPYMAHREELDYITSEEACNQLEEIMSEPENDMSLYNNQGLLIGLWQGRHGFYRKFKL